MSTTHLEEPEFVWSVWGAYDNGADIADVDISTGNCDCYSGVGSAWAWQVWDMGYDAGDSVQRSLDFWMPLSSYGGCQSGLQHAKSQSFPAGSHTLVMRMIPWFDILAISECSASVC